MIKIENPWLLNQEKYDRQMQEPKAVCQICGEHTSEITEYPNGDIICDLCESEYLERYADQYRQGYIDAEEAQGYYMEWYFDNLPQETKMKIVRAAYDCYSEQEQQEMAKDQRRYIEQCCKYDYQQYVKAQLLA